MRIQLYRLSNRLISNIVENRVSIKLRKSAGQLTAMEESHKPEASSYQVTVGEEWQLRWGKTPQTRRLLVNNRANTRTQEARRPKGTTQASMDPRVTNSNNSISKETHQGFLEQVESISS